MEVTRRQRRRRKKLLDDLKDRRGYSHLKEEALDRTMWRNRFRGGFGPVVRQNTEWMTLYHSGHRQHFTTEPIFISWFLWRLFWWYSSNWCLFQSNNYVWCGKDLGETPLTCSKVQPRNLPGGNSGETKIHCMQCKRMYVVRSQKHALTPASINLQKCKHSKLTPVVTW